MNKLIYSWMAAASLFCITGCNNATTTEKEKVVASSSHDYAKLNRQIDSLAHTLDCKVSVGLVYIENGDTFSYNGHEHRPMMSTCKFPLALMVLDKVDSGLLSLEQKVFVSKAEMRTGTHSPLRDSLKSIASDVSIHELMYYSITMSDNITTDVLLKQVGGPMAVAEYAKSKGMTGISMLHTEEHLGLNMQHPYENWCEPMGMAKLLASFYKGEVVSKTSTDTLRRIMERTSGGANRIKGMLPEGTVVGHKTGTSGFENGLNIAVNDIGVVTLPNGQHLALAVYVTDAKAETPVCEKLIAQISRVVYDDALDQ